MPWPPSEAPYWTESSGATMSLTLTLDVPLSGAAPNPGGGDPGEVVVSYEDDRLVPVPQGDLPVGDCKTRNPAEGFRFLLQGRFAARIPPLCAGRDPESHRGALPVLRFPQLGSGDAVRGEEAGA